MDAAFRVFAERGYGATRLDEVADAVGVTKGAIYYYFDGKEDLLRRAVENGHGAVFSDLAQELNNEDRAPAAAKVRLVLRRIWNHWLDPRWGHALRLMLGEVSVGIPELFRTWALVGPIQGWSLVRDLIQRGVSDGEFRADVDPEVAARLVVSGLMLQAVLHVHMGLSQVAPCDTDRIFDSSVDLFIHGLAVTHAKALPGAPVSG
ncbi:MAG TPA: TetR/AcrR family transcriptional regulator [Longimicrobiales bacterium]|nr:TetR/AcrR family transcriptional regulator [Longimicrobiales bacterium]